MTDTCPAPALLHWTEGGQALVARWRSERGEPPPAQVVVADDTLAANAALRMASEGTGLLWRGDFHNARHLLQALARRVDRPPRNPVRNTFKAKADQDPAADDAQEAAARAAFLAHRQAQARRAQVLGQVLVPMHADYSIPLRRAPDHRQACTQAWGAPQGEAPWTVSLRELLGVVSAFEWRKNGVPVPALDVGPRRGHRGEDAPRIHPHHGVFSPVRGEYVELVAQAPWPPAAAASPGGKPQTAFDIGTGTGVLAAVLARRGVARVLATDSDPRAVACALENLARLVPAGQVRVLQTDLFPSGRADLVVCNPPWVPGPAVSSLERAVYDVDSRMLLGFLNGLAEHLVPQGEAWLILSDLAEHLGLRSRAFLLAAIAHAGLQVLGRIDTRPTHHKVSAQDDPLHAARAAEVTSLWRLGLAE
jgi:methylase of polypeptide subunit release factors